jgi:GT2 family glycosyltransferase
MKKAAIIIVNWNGDRFLKNCLSAVLNQSYKNFTVYLVDNGSKDSSLSLVKENFPQIQIIALKMNTGYAQGNNIGIRKALKDKKISYVVCLNNDTVVSKNWLSSLIKTAQSKKNIGAVSSKAYFSDGETIQNAGLEFTKTLQINRPGGISVGFGKTDKDMPELSRAREVFAAGGVAPLYTRDVLEKLITRDGEIFDEDFFAYAEDYDLGFRIRSFGYKACLSANAKLIHLHSQTSGVASPLKAFYCERNAYLVAIKNLPFIDLILFPFRNAVLKTSYFFKKNHSVKILQTRIGLLNVLQILIKAHISTLLLLPKMLKKRRKIRNRISFTP